MPCQWTLYYVGKLTISLLLKLVWFRIFLFLSAEGIQVAKTLIMTPILNPQSFMFSWSILISSCDFSCCIAHWDSRAGCRTLPADPYTLTLGHFYLNKSWHYSFVSNHQGCKVLLENYKIMPGGHTVTHASFLPKALTAVAVNLDFLLFPPPHNYWCWSCQLICAFTFSPLGHPILPGQT